MRKIFDSYFNPNLALSVQVFNLLGFFGTLAGIVMAGVCVLQNAKAPSVLFNLIPSTDSEIVFSGFTLVTL